MVYGTEKQDGAQANGEVKISSSVSTEEKDRIWEHPWGTNEIRKSSGHWTLAGDAGLLNHLQEFSHKLISRTHEMEKMVDSVMHKSKVVSAKVNNVINDFQMLSNLQFVENRVYDEEAREPTTSPVPEAQPKTKEQREAEMVPRVIKALKLGMAVLDSAFEKIEVDETSDSEEDEDDVVSQGRTVLEPKDIYEHRPLPFVIGSLEFQNADYAGLSIVVEDELSPETTQEDNISESEESEESEEEEEAEELPPKQQPIIKAEHKATIISNKHIGNNISDSEGSDLFDMGDQENGYASDSPVEEKPKESNIKSNLMEELMKKSKGVPPDKNKPETIQNPVSKKVPEENESFNSFDDDDDDEALFQDAENDSSPFRKHSGLFSGSGGIFGSKKDEKENLFNDDDDDGEPPPPFEVKRSSISKVKVLPALPEKNAQQSKPEKKKNEVLISENSKSPTLFGEDDDDESEDLFGSFSTKSSASSHHTAKTSPAVSTPVEKVEKSSPSALPSNTNKNTFSTVKESGSSNVLFGDDSDADDLFTVTKKSPKVFDFKTPPPVAASDDDDDDDLFSIKPTSKSKKDTKVSKEKGSTSPAHKTAKDPLLSLFEASDNFDLLNPAGIQKPKYEVEKAKTKGSEPFLSEKKSSSLLFEESDSFDLFSPAVEAKPFSPAVEAKPFSPAVEAKPKANSTVEKKEPDKTTLPKAQEIGLSSKTQELFVSSSEKTSRITGDENAPLDFSKPFNASSTLGAMNKGRAKIQVKRKKSTRKGRQALMASQSDDSLVVVEEVKTTNAGLSVEQRKSSSTNIFGTVEEPRESEIVADSIESKKPQNTFEQQEKDKKNLMSQLMAEAASLRIGKQQHSSVAAVGDMKEEEDDEDLFSSKPKGNKKLLGSDFSFLSPTSPEPSEVLVKASSDVEGPNFQTSSVLSDTSSDDDLFSAPSFRDFRTSISDKNSIFGDGEDDMFKVIKETDSVSQQSSDILGDDNDDIFAGVEKEKYEMFPTQVFDDDDDDDIFSNFEKPSKENPPKTKVPENISPAEKKSQNNIFDDPLGISGND